MSFSDHEVPTITTTTTREIGCQTEPNLIDKLIHNGQSSKQRLGDVDLYQEYVRSAQCAQFWPLDKNPIRTLVPSLIKVDLPEQHLKNESLMLDLVQAISNNSMLVNLLAKYMHHIVPNVIISKRIDLIPLITCTIRVCRDPIEQERLISLLFNLIKRPNEEQRRMILAGIIVVLQVSPNQNSTLLLPNLYDHVSDKFPERRILLAESCASLAHYVRPALRTNLILSILIQLLKDPHAAVRLAACKSFACLLTLIMDRNDEVFDACLQAAGELIQDVLQQTPMSFCEHRYELQEMRFCALEAIYPLICLWAVKLNRFKMQLAEFYLSRADKYLTTLISGQPALGNGINQISGAAAATTNLVGQLTTPLSSKIAAAAEVARRRSIFLESRHKRETGSTDSGLSGGLASPSSCLSSLQDNSAIITAQRAVSAYLKMLTYLVPYVFADSVHSCAWLSKSSSSDNSPDNNNNNNNNDSNQINNNQENTNHDLNQEGKLQAANRRGSSQKSNVNVHLSLFEKPLNLSNKLLDPCLILEDSAIIAFHDQIDSMHIVESLDWVLEKFLPKFLKIIGLFSQKRFQSAIGWTSSATPTTHHQPGSHSATAFAGATSASSRDSSISSSSSGSFASTPSISSSPGPPSSGFTAAPSPTLMVDLLTNCISSIRNLCLLFGSQLTKTRIRPHIRDSISAYSTPPTNPLSSLNNNNKSNHHSNHIHHQQSNNNQNNNITTNNNNNSNNNNNLNPSSSANWPPISLYIVQLAALTAFEPIEQPEFELLVHSLSSALSIPSLSRCDVEMLASSIAILATNEEHIRSPSSRQKFLTYSLDALVTHSIKFINNSTSHATKAKENILIIFRHILTCLIEPAHRPSDWAHILVSKFLPTLIGLANDSTDVYTCTYARLMCAKLVETFDNYFNDPKLSRAQAEMSLPALESLKALTEQIKASNLKRQIECLLQDIRGVQ